MDHLELVLAVSGGLAVVCGILAWRGLTGRSGGEAERRLKALRDPAAGEETVGAGTDAFRLVRVLRDSLVRLGRRSAAEKGELHQETSLTDKLVQAGFRHPAATSLFLAVKIVLLVGTYSVAGLLCWWATGQALQAVTAALALAVAAFFAPDLYLRWRRTSRQRALERELPDVLDLLVVCTQAGLGLDAAIDRVAEATAASCPNISGELRIMNLEAQIGRPRAEVLRQFARRTGIEATRSLAAILIQSDRFGTSIAQALNANADALRVKRRLRAEEAAGRAAIQMLFPLVFCIFPAIFVVLAGPAVLRLCQTLLPSLLGATPIR